MLRKDTKRPPIKVKWVDRNAGDRQRVNARSRQVAKQINTGKEQGMFASTPPLEALRRQLSATVTRKQAQCADVH